MRPLRAAGVLTVLGGGIEAGRATARGDTGGTGGTRGLGGVLGFALVLAAGGDDAGMDGVATRGDVDSGRVPGWGRALTRALGGADDAPVAVWAGTGGTPGTSVRALGGSVARRAGGTRGTSDRALGGVSILAGGSDPARTGGVAVRLDTGAGRALEGLGTVLVGASADGARGFGSTAVGGASRAPGPAVMAAGDRAGVGAQTGAGVCWVGVTTAPVLTVGTPLVDCGGVLEWSARDGSGGGTSAVGPVGLGMTNAGLFLGGTGSTVLARARSIDLCVAGHEGFITR